MIDREARKLQADYERRRRKLETPNQHVAYACYLSLMRAVPVRERAILAQTLADLADKPGQAHLKRVLSHHRIDNLQAFYLETEAEKWFTTNRKGRATS